MSADRYPNVLRPIDIGPVPVANRFYMPSHGLGMMTAGGPLGSVVPNEDQVAYYVERAAAGVALLYHSQPVMPRQPLPSAYYQEGLPSFRALTDAIHAHGSKVFAQLHYYSGHTTPWDPMSPMLPVVGPSTFQRFLKYDTVHQMTPREIALFIESTGRCAHNLRNAGYDGIELHAAHGMLHEQFLSPYFNKRTDEWGGDLEGRMRFLVEGLRTVRDAVGAGMAVGIRLNCDEMLPGALTQDDTREILDRLIDLRLIDYVDLDIAVEPQQAPFMTTPVTFDPLFYVPFAANVGAIAKGRVVVMACAGRLTSIAQVEQLLADDVADMIGCVRGLIAEPELLRNAIEGHEERSRTCIACNSCIGANRKVGWGCVINPATGRERRWGVDTFAPAPAVKRTVVVGGGPGGLEAARVAALRGHRVTLFERRDQLGGQLNLWGRLPDREIMNTTRDWQIQAVRDLGVDIRTGLAATAADVLAERPDAVVLATGSHYTARGESGFMAEPVPGWDRDFVYTPEQILDEGARPSGRVLILDEDQSFAGVGIAQLLAAAGASVELVTREFSTVPLSVFSSLDFPIVMARLKQLGLRSTPGSYVKEIGDGTVTVFDILTNDEEVREVDSVVLVTMRLAEDDLGSSLDGEVAQLYLVGDALAPRGLFEAMYEGHRFARLIGEPGAPGTSTEALFQASPQEWFPRPAATRSVVREPAGVA
jgi:2,4-dienoyl-CoA reductase-like NADH-dependent reductase (Old Yellow Enzyme family)